MTAMTPSSSAAAADSKFDNNLEDEIEEDSIQQVQPPEVKER